MAALHKRGFHLIPCGGEDGKKPLRATWNNPSYKRMPLDVVTNVMRRNNSCTYGIRLDSHCVVDCDTWNAQTRTLVENAIPGTLFRVSTSRGKHFYFEIGEGTPVNIRTDNVSIDFKSGPGHFVLGPGSIRPDGNAYESSIPNLDLLPELPRFRWNSSKGGAAEQAQKRVEALSGKIAIGRRNPWLTGQAATIARDAISLEDLLLKLKARAETWFASSENFPDTEIEKIARWAWELRCQNKLYGGLNSTFQVNRTVLSILQPLGTKASNVLFLYSVLLSTHGHKTNATFPISVAAMCKADLLPFKKSAAHDAKQVLMDAGLIRRVQIGVFKEAHLYQLSNASLLAEQP